MNTGTGYTPRKSLSEESRRNILEDAGVFARDPSAFPGLSLKLDSAHGLDPSFRPVGYDTRRTTGVMVHCSICTQQQQHFDGAIIRLLDGKIGLVGNSCGRKHFFGDDGWTSITNRILKDEEQAIFLARFGPAKAQVAIVDDLMGEWVGVLQSVEETRNRFKSEMSQLFGAVCKQIRSGELSIEEERQVPFRHHDGHVEMRSEIFKIVVCRLDVDWFFLGDTLSETVERVRPQLIESLDYLRADATHLNVVGVKRLMKICRDSLQIVAEKQQKLKSLTSEKTIAQIAKWANLTQKGKISYQARGKVLMMIGGDALVGTVNFEKISLNIDSHWNDIKSNWPSL
jgi:hypothetical protein